MGQAKRDIKDRFLTREAAERYRNRFLRGKRARTHRREARALSLLLARLGPFNVVADVASGAGRFAHVLAEHSAFLIQTDIAYPMLEINRESFPLDSARAAYAQGDARRLPLEDNFADLVFCHRLLNHLGSETERTLVIAELARVSRRYVVLSSLSIPFPLRIIRGAYRQIVSLLTRKTRPDPCVVQSEVVRDAERRGLTFAGHGPIRSFPARAEFLLFAKAMVRRRHEHSTCISCGYDLLASRERCPECGERI